MDILELSKLVQNEHAEPYRVTFCDGNTKIIRLWKPYKEFSCVARMNRKARRYGHYLENYDIKNWVSVRKINSQKIDLRKRVDSRANQAKKMLEKSGFWEDILKEINVYLSLSDEEKDEFVNDLNTDHYNIFYNQNLNGKYKYEWCGATREVFHRFLSDRCWVYPLYETDYQREYVEKNLLDLINGKTTDEFCTSWRKKYDNTISAKYNSFGKKCAWYSTEYKDCANGHYYLMFDEKHAIFIESD